MELLLSCFFWKISIYRIRAVKVRLPWSSKFLSWKKAQLFPSKKSFVCFVKFVMICSNGMSSIDYSSLFTLQHKCFITAFTTFTCNQAKNVEAIVLFVYETIKCNLFGMLVYFYIENFYIIYLRGLFIMDHRNISRVNGSNYRREFKKVFQKKNCFDLF